jgi:hypothetical protein
MRGDPMNKQNPGRKFSKLKPTSPKKIPPKKDLRFSLTEGLGLDSWALTYLVSVYEQGLKEAQKKAMKAFWSAAEACNKPYQDGWQFINDEELKLLKEAADGNLKAIQCLVERNPNVVYLPFVADKIIDILEEYKFSMDSGKLNEKRDLVWRGFLPRRMGGKNYFNDEDLGNKMKNLMERRKIDKRPAAEIVAKLCDIGFDKLYRIRVVGKRGRSLKKKTVERRID